MVRTILHLDLDCFYAQVEAHRLGIPPEQPLAVVQWSGLLAVNYPARRFGIKRGMRVTEAKALCPGLHTPHVATIGFSLFLFRAIGYSYSDFYRRNLQSLFSLQLWLGIGYPRSHGYAKTK